MNLIEKRCAIQEGRTESHTMLLSNHKAAFAYDTSKPSSIEFSYVTPFPWNFVLLWIQLLLTTYIEAAYVFFAEAKTSQLKELDEKDVYRSKTGKLIKRKCVKDLNPLSYHL
ncbi:hypothetical protein EDC96DRAFT_548691 [Choanephora cucurbitarum]|nr:hypothetical protein EDC96DRAFT_548691 [Choanephora cucurbitarum]